MFEKLLEILERIAVALERSAAYANTAPKSAVNNAAAPAGKPAGKSSTKEDSKASPLSGRPSSESQAKDPDDGLGDEPKTITFEDMRAKMVAVKQHPKLGPTKSSKIFEEYGKLPEIKESDFAAVVAKCDKLLKSVA